MPKRPERQEKPEGQPTARMQFQLDPDKVPWLYALLHHSPAVDLYKGKFPNPFEGLVYQARLQEDQLLLIANLVVGEEFQSRYGNAIGSPESLDLFLRRYSGRHQFDPECRQLTIFEGDQVHGMIVRPREDLVVIQRGGTAGPLTLGENPINTLTVQVDETNVLVQRFVMATWNDSLETDQRRFRLILGLPQLPEGAAVARTYFDTFAIVGKEFRARPRPVDLEEDIGGYPEAKALMKSLVMDMTDPDTSRKFGTQPFSNRFALVTGREGTGKSLFPKALDRMLRAVYGDRLEHFRIGFTDLLLGRAPVAALMTKTILDHVRENERNRIPTLLHLDNLEMLLPATLRQRIIASNLFSPDQDHRVTPMPDAEFVYKENILAPVIEVIRNFGRDLGGECHYVIVLGESRIPRDELPDGVSRTFRRTVSLDNPTPADLAGMLRVQIATTRQFAERAKTDPFAAGIDLRLGNIAAHAVGLVGRDIQQALIHIADKHKAEWDGETATPVTEEEIIEALEAIRSERHIQTMSGARAAGFLALLGRS